MREITLDELISSIRDLASSFASNSEEVRKEVTSMSGECINAPFFEIYFFVNYSQVLSAKYGKLRESTWICLINKL